MVRRSLSFVVVCAWLMGCGDEPSPGMEPDEATGEATTEADHGSTGVAEVTSSTTGSKGATDATTEAESSGGEVDVPPPDPDPVFGVFTWPVDAWVSATDYYQTGAPHSGSADLSGPYWSPVGAARAGTVVAAQWTTIGGYLVRIDHGGGYRTLYSHLTEAPIVDVGDEVETNEVIGYLGRTGNAFRGGAHVHFSIQLDGERQLIPTLDFAQWVERGQPIPGPWAGLDELEIPHETFDVRVTADVLPVFAGPANSEALIGELLEGEVVTVRGSDRGYYRIWHDAADGWIVHSGTLPVDSQLFGVEVVPSTASVRAEPDPRAAAVGSQQAGDRITVFEEVADHYRLLYDLPTTYAWIAVADTEPTPEFSTRIRAASANVRAGPGIEHDVLGSLSFFDAFIVREEHRGWYRLTHDGQDAWVAGWLTSGRL